MFVKLKDVTTSKAFKVSDRSAVCSILANSAGVSDLRLTSEHHLCVSD